MAEKKKILIVDDSVLIRNVLCDIINSDGRFQVTDRASNGLEAFDLITRKQFDAVILDINMPKMSGVELLRELQKRKISVRVMMASTDTIEGAAVTMECLDLGALDFIHKPDSAADIRLDKFRTKFLRILSAVVVARPPSYTGKAPLVAEKDVKKVVELVSRHAKQVAGSQMVAIASSTGGPKALQQVIPFLPANLGAPVVIVQHMPEAFTKTLAERLKARSQIMVREAEEGDVLQAGTVLLARGGLHLHIRDKAGKQVVHYTDDPPREGVKPCANFMYESLCKSRYARIVCVVLTGMGADGTAGIKALKEAKKIHTIAQDEKTSIVYGMPRSIAKAGLADQVVPLQRVAEEIVMCVGVK